MIVFFKYSSEEESYAKIHILIIFTLNTYITKKLTETNGS